MISFSRVLMTLSACFCLGAGSAVCGEVLDGRPNIVFILLDDLGKEWIGCYGAEGIETPSNLTVAAPQESFVHKTGYSTKENKQ